MNFKTYRNSPRASPAGDVGALPPLGPPPPSAVERTSSGGLSSLSPDEAIHLLQSQVGDWLAGVEGAG